MAPVPRITGSKLLVQITDGNSPENFAQDCFINTQRGIQFTSETDEVIMPDCDNPDDPSWKAVTKDGLMATINGAGRLYAPSLSDWWAWYISPDPKNCRVLVNALNGGYWAGAFHLTGFDVGAESLKGTVEVSSITLAGDGTVTWVPSS